MELTPGKRKHIEDTQLAFAEMKKLAVKASGHMRAMAAQERADSNFWAGNAAGRVEGDMDAILAMLKQAHMRASDALLEHYPDDGGVIIQGGGGR